MGGCARELKGRSQSEGRWVPGGEEKRTMTAPVKLSSHIWRKLLREDKQGKQEKPHLHEIVVDPEPWCPSCGRPMVLIMPKYWKGQEWAAFFGCSNYPQCKGSRRIDTETGTAIYSADEKKWAQYNQDPKKYDPEQA